MGRLGALKGFDVLEDGVLAQVVTDELRHVRVDGFVVRDAVTDSVRQRDVSGAVSAHYTGNSEHRVRAERERIEILVVHAPVDHVDARQPADGLHVDDVAVNHQVAPFHQLDAHLLREKAVLEVGAVVDTRREQHDHRIAHAARRERPKNLAQLGRVMRDRQHVMHMERMGERARHHRAILEHVGDPAGGPHIVLEHQEIAGFRIAHQVDPGNVGMDAGGRLQPDHLPAEMLAGVNKRPRDDPVLENPLRSVDILEEKIERDDALAEPVLDVVPLLPGKNARRQVEREEPFRATAVAIDGEGDALEQE